MKSKKKIFLGIILSFIILLTLTGCFNKRELLVSEFTERAKEYGLKVEDETNYYKESPYKILEVAKASNNNWQIEFFELESNKECKKLFDIAKNDIESAKKTGTSTSYIDLANHQKVTFTSNEYYIVASRIGHTLVYVETKVEYKDDVKAFLKKINY